jgi:hypothetical protein
MNAAAESGGCLCGAVRVAARLADGRIEACHCGQCRRWTGGGPLFSVRVGDLTVEGADDIAAYHASAWGERAFCRVCGTTPYWRMQGRPVAFVAAGLLDDQSGLTVAEEIFCDLRAPWFPTFAGASQSTEARELARLDACLYGEEQP